MSEPAKAERPAAAKTEAAKPKSSAPLPKGDTPAKPALARLRRALGELLGAYRNNQTHMIAVHASNLRTALNNALKYRAVATDVERAELDDMATRSRKLLTQGTPSANPKPTGSDEEILGIDWDVISDSLDQFVPGMGPAVTKMPQAYRDGAEAVTRTPFFAGQAFGEQWEKIRENWPQFVKTAAAMLGLQFLAMTLAAIPEPTMVTKVIAVVVQAALIAFVVEGMIGMLQSAIEVPKEASNYAQDFLANVQAANGNQKQIDAAALNLARLVVMIVNAIAAKAAQLGVREAMKAFRDYRAEKDALAKKDEPSSTPAKEKSSNTKPDAPSSKSTKSNSPTATNNATSSSKPAATKPPEKPRINEPVQGVWEQNQKPHFTQPGFTHLEVHDTPIHTARDGTRSMKTYILDPTNPEGGGWMERSYNPRTGQFSLDNAFLDKLPSKIRPASGASLTPTGTPTQTYLTLRQMKALGVQYGALKKVKMSTVQNIQSVIELEVLKQKGLSPSAAVAKTHSVSYAETTIIQSGHRIASVEYVKNHEMRKTLDSLMRHYETRGETVEPIQSVVDTHKALIDTYGKGVVNRDTIVSYNYDIEITLEPFKASIP